jgi:hypothetical protein
MSALADYCSIGDRLCKLGRRVFLRVSYPLDFVAKSLRRSGPKECGRFASIGKYQ